MLQGMLPSPPKGRPEARLHLRPHPGSAPSAAQSCFPHPPLSPTPNPRASCSKSSTPESQLQTLLLKISTWGKARVLGIPPRVSSSSYALSVASTRVPHGDDPAPCRPLSSEGPERASKGEKKKKFAQCVYSSASASGNQTPFHETKTLL